MGSPKFIPYCTFFKDRQLKYNQLVSLYILLLSVHKVGLFVCLMVFKATFNNISVIYWKSVLLMEVPRENHHPVASH